MGGGHLRRPSFIPPLLLMQISVIDHRGKLYSIEGVAMLKEIVRNNVQKIVSTLVRVHYNTLRQAVIFQLDALEFTLRLPASPEAAPGIMKQCEHWILNDTRIEWSYNVDTLQLLDEIRILPQPRRLVLAEEPPCALL